MNPSVVQRKAFQQMQLFTPLLSFDKTNYINWIYLSHDSQSHSKGVCESILRHAWWQWGFHTEGLFCTSIAVFLLPYIPYPTALAWAWGGGGGGGHGDSPPHFSFFSPPCGCNTALFCICTHALLLSLFCRLPFTSSQFPCLLKTNNNLLCNRTLFFLLPQFVPIYLLNTPNEAPSDFNTEWGLPGVSPPLRTVGECQTWRVMKGASSFRIPRKSRTQKLHDI